MCVSNPTLRSTGVCYLLAFFFAIFGVSACRDAQSPEPRVNAAESLGEMRRLPLAPAIVQAGCAAAVANGHGVARVVVLGRNEMPIQLPALGIAAGTGPGSKALRLVRFTVTRATGGATQRVVFACLETYRRPHQQQLREIFGRLARDGDWTAFEQKLGGATAALADLPLEILTGNALLRSIFPQLRINGHAVGAVLWSSDTGNIAAKTLPPINVTASRTAYIIDSYLFMLGAIRTFSFSDLIDWNFSIVDEHCAEVSEYHAAEDLELRYMEEEGALIARSGAELNSDQCYVNYSKPLCVDFFIRNRRSFVFSGNDRDFNPYAGISDSKAHLYIDPTSLAREVKINSTHLLVGHTELWPKHDSVGLFDPDRDVKVERLSNGDLKIDVTFRNNYCPSTSGCPSINASLHLVKDSSKPGGYEVYWDRDGYPSMGVYMLKGQADGTGVEYVTMAEDPELSDSGWLAWMNLIDNRRRSRKLPPYCIAQ